VSISFLWQLKYMWNNRRALRSPEDYVKFLGECAAAPEAAYFPQNSARAGDYPEGPDGGWRYDFTRLPAHDKLLKAYKLDEIAGQGSAFDRALRLMDWLSAHTWYNGMSIWSARLPDDGLKILRYAHNRSFGRCLNCRHKAIALADCLRAAGMAAMPVGFCNYTYRPGEEKVIPTPNHLTVHLWLPEERRWVMLDPSFNSYVTDENGRALNLIEIQKRHRQGEPLSVARYALNGTQDFRAGYLNGFVLGSLLEIVTLGGACRLLPGDVPRKDDDKARALTVAELLAEPNIKEP